MATDTKIQWCDSTVNPTTGCDGCELADKAGKVDLCYAKHMHERRLAKAHPKLYAGSFFDVRQLPVDVIDHRMSQAAKWSDLRGVERPDKPWIPASMPRLIFISDMADAMSKDVSFGYLAEHVMPHIVSDAGSRHMWLTSITSPAKVKPRIDGLLSIPAKWRGLSIGPILAGPIQIEKHRVKRMCEGYPQWVCDERCDYRTIDWAVVGGASSQGQDAPPTRVEHFYDLLDQCRDAGVPAFVKQLGSNPTTRQAYAEWPDGTRLSLPVADARIARLRDHHGGDWSEWPKNLRVREFPAAWYGGAT